MNLVNENIGDILKGKSEPEIEKSLEEKYIGKIFQSQPALPNLRQKIIEVLYIAQYEDTKWAIVYKPITGKFDERHRITLSDDTKGEEIMPGEELYAEQYINFEKNWDEIDPKAYCQTIKGQINQLQKRYNIIKPYIK